MMVHINSNLLDTIQAHIPNQLKNKVEFKLIADDDLQVITAVTDHLGDGVLFNILENKDDTFMEHENEWH
ncbi:MULTISPECIES: hypothetical protein [Lactobacillus]|uniref:Uncharacterized protein n=1 Tax=Lactobacillus xujianguonis TaxID=2495899 RepID=A0A437STC6_9LACO|nr:MULTISPECIES: hypothetical protein [Lactobacillus]RVU70114.1 hypothetical protein EJK17_09325 [Lactobacillus xujianguonis]RVU73084.1 hypothetical protein EJK20_09695 [Lactobacillus xujianguonis]